MAISTTSMQKLTIVARKLLTLARSYKIDAYKAAVLSSKNTGKGLPLCKEISPAKLKSHNESKTNSTRWLIQVFFSEMVLIGKFQ